jgi:hypothetical protein
MKRNIADLNKSMWIGLARKPQWRCLIPVTEFAEAEGAKGSKTRTWFRVKDQPIFAYGGLWRESGDATARWSRNSHRSPNRHSWHRPHSSRCLPLSPCSRTGRRGVCRIGCARRCPALVA